MQIPQRSDTGTPIAELLTPITSNNRPQKRRSTLPPLPRLKIERVNTRRTSRQFSQILCTPDTLVSCLTPVAPSNELSRHKPIDSSFYRSTAAAAAGPLSPLSPVGPSLSTVAASVISHPSTRHAKPNFPYGYQSEYPEAIESGPSIPPPAALGPAERQREIQFLAEEERLIRQRVRATEELIRLRNEEARILDRKKQLGIGR